MTGIGKKIVNFCAIYFKEILALSKGKPLSVDEDMAFRLHLIDKTVECLSGVGKLLELSEGKNMAYLKNPICILLRSCLSDVILQYWIVYSKDDTDLSDKIDILRRDHIKYYISYLKKMDSLGLLEAQDKIYEIDILNTNFLHLMDSKLDYNFSNVSYPKSVSITQMLNNDTKINPAFVEAYKAYFLFSKLEHSGEFTRLIIDELYKENSNIDQHIESAIFTIEKTIIAFMSIYFKDYDITVKLKQAQIYN